MLINVKTPTFVGILTPIIMTNTSPGSLKAREVFNFQHFSPYEQLKLPLSWVEHEKKLYTPGPVLSDDKSRDSSLII